MERFKKLYKPILKPVRPGQIIKKTPSYVSSINDDSIITKHLSNKESEEKYVKEKTDNIDQDVLKKDDVSEGVLVGDDDIIMTDLDSISNTIDSLPVEVDLLPPPPPFAEDKKLPPQSQEEKDEDKLPSKEQPKNILDQMLLECREQVLSCQHKMDLLEAELPDSLSLLTDQLNQLHNVKLELMLETM